MNVRLNFISRFLFLSVLGFAAQLLLWGDSFVVAPVIQGLASASGALMGVFGGAAEVVGDVIQSGSNDFAIRIDNGCSGIEAVILVSAAVLAYPASGRSRVVGLLACTAAILGVNVLRIISLFYLGQYSMTLFDWAHLYAWDLLIMVDGLIAFLLWVRYSALASVTSQAIA